MEYTTNCLILGSGGAGYTAGIYTARANLQPILITGNEIGGQLATTSDVENFPGFEKILGAELMDKMREQAIKCGAQIIQDNIIDVDFSVYPFVFKSNSNIYYAKTAIIATGAKARWLGLPAEEKYRGFGVSACAVCDGPFFKNKVVAVVGGGNSAITEAIYLSTLAKKVYLIHRSENFKAENVLLERINNIDNIEKIVNTNIVDIIGDEDALGKFVKEIKIETNDTSLGKITKNIPVDGVFVAIGHSPCVELFKGKLKLTERGYIDANKDTLETSVAGVFVAGDVRNETHKQAVIACADGCICALEVEKFLQSKQY